MTRKLPPPPRRLDLFSRLVIQFGALYATGGWLLLAILSGCFWAARWGVTFGLILSLTAIPLVVLGVASVYQSIRSGTLAVRLLRTGRFTRGKLVDVSFANVRTGLKVVKAMRYLPGEHQRFSGHPEMSAERLPDTLEKAIRESQDEEPERTMLHYSVKFRADDGREYFARGTTDAQSGTKIEDEALEPVLYLADNPNRALILDAIVHLPEIRPDGSLAPLPPDKFVYLILPLGVVVVNLALGYGYFGG